jgi:NDP-sugar pyrophosphorylase family protein
MPETRLASFVRDLSRLPGRAPGGPPWQLIGHVEALVRDALGTLGEDFARIGPEIAAHRTATVASSAELAGPVILGPGCRVGPGTVLRGGVWADQDVTIGPHSEIKASLVFAGSAAAHRNYVGNSIIGQDVNLEAGAVLANHFNERADKSVLVALDGNVLATGLTKFGAILGDGCRIGANAVTSPGTLLPPGTIVPRLALVDQLA